MSSQVWTYSPELGNFPKAVRALASKDFRVAVREPYTATLTRAWFIVDLYTPAIRLGRLHGWWEALGVMR
jgi:hypothetical protein